MKAQLFRLKQKEKHCHNTCHKQSLEMLPKTGCATAVGVYLIKAVHNCMHDIGKSLRCPLKISCFLVPRHSPQLTSRWSARTLWKMSWTFLKQQTKSAQESRSTFHNLLCKVTGMGPLAAQQQMAKLLLESTLCLVPDELGAWVAHLEESLEGNGSTAIPKPNFSRSGPQFRALDQSCHFCCFSWSRRKHYHHSILHSFPQWDAGRQASKATDTPNMMQECTDLTSLTLAPIQGKRLSNQAFSTAYSLNVAMTVSFKQVYNDKNKPWSSFPWVAKRNEFKKNLQKLWDEKVINAKIQMQLLAGEALTSLTGRCWECMEDFGISLSSFILLAPNIC